MPREILRQGEPLTRQLINSIIPQALKSIFAGPGIRIVPTSDSICIMSDGKDKFSPGLGGGGGSGGGMNFLGEFDYFPAIPESGYATFYHTTDTQMFLAYAGDDVWAPMQAMTTLDCVPDE